MLGHIYTCYLIFFYSHSKGRSFQVHRYSKMLKEKKNTFYNRSLQTVLLNICSFYYCSPELFALVHIFSQVLVALSCFFCGQERGLLYFKNCLVLTTTRVFLGGPVTKTPHSHWREAPVQSLVRDHIPCASVKSLQAAPKDPTCHN